MEGCRDNCTGLNAVFGVTFASLFLSLVCSLTTLILHEQVIK